MSTTSSYLLECLTSWRKLPMGLDPDTPSGILEFIGGLAWSQYLAVTSNEDGGAGPTITAPRGTMAVLLDDFWSRHLLKEVPAIVQRVQKLEVLGTEYAPSEMVQLYFTQAMKCYAMGLSEAAVALLRTCLEKALEETVPYASEVAETKGEQKLVRLIDWAGRCRKLDAAHMQMAHQVRKSANDVLHKKPCTSDDVFGAVTMLRAVVGTLYGIVDE